jgi:hypothetical protein
MTREAAFELARTLRAQGHRVRIVKRRFGRELLWYVECL